MFIFFQHKIEIFLHFPNAFLSNNIASKNIFVRVEQCFYILARKKHTIIYWWRGKDSFVIKEERKYGNYYTGLSLIWLKLVTLSYQRGYEIYSMCT